MVAGKLDGGRVAAAMVNEGGSVRPPRRERDEDDRASETAPLG